MPDVLTPDICVIGAGAGGLAVGLGAAALGVPVVIIEQNKMGGAALNTGCVPSAALRSAAKRAALMRDREPFGVAEQPVKFDFTKVIAHVHRVVGAVAPSHSPERLAALGARVIQGHAAFKDRRTVAVGDIEVRARRFVIATGSTPTVPTIKGLDEGPYFTPDTIFALTELPQHLIVIGVGRVGLALAQAFRRFGSEVTVLDTAPPLAAEDTEAAAIVMTALEREGITIRTGVNLAEVACSVGHVTLTLDGRETIQGSHLLVAIGRKAATAGLGLEAAGIRHDDTGILVNRKLKTRNRRVYAIGDAAAGQPRFTHAATYHAGLVLKNALFRLSVRADTAAIPRVIFTEPEVAQAGLTEAEARSRGHKIRIVRWPYHDNDRAQALRATRGHIKVVTTGRGTILGATIVGAQASELIATWSLAIAQGLNIRAFTEVVLPYPTFAEIGQRAAIDYFTPGLTRPWLRRIIAWLRVLG